MKLPNAIVRLGIFIEERRAQPYVWGKNDCGVFAADSAWAITGKDPIEGIRGKWHDEESAMAILQKHGGLIAIMDSRFKRRPLPTFAQRGDIVLVRDFERKSSLAVCLGEFAAAPGFEEMLLVSMNQWRVAWEVE